MERGKGESKMPALPKVFTKIKRKETDKEYIKLNALEVIHSGIRAHALTHHHTAPKKKHVRAPQYTEMPGYGRVPEYLSKRASAQKQEKDERAQASADRAAQKKIKEQMERGVIPLPEEERQRVLHGLKTNWEQLNSDYQKLSLTVDTVPKITR